MALKSEKAVEYAWHFNLLKRYSDTFQITKRWESIIKSLGLL